MKTNELDIRSSWTVDEHGVRPLGEASNRRAFAQKYTCSFCGRIGHSVCACPTKAEFLGAVAERTR